MRREKPLSIYRSDEDKTDAREADNTNSTKPKVKIEEEGFSPAAI